MALTVDEIAEILNSMRVENENNVENFEKVLTDISAKLELMAGDSEDADLIKVYLTELKGLVEDKSVDTNTRFADIEKFCIMCFCAKMMLQRLQNLKIYSMYLVLHLIILRVIL